MATLLQRKQQKRWERIGQMYRCVGLLQYILHSQRNYLTPTQIVSLTRAINEITSARKIDFSPALKEYIRSIK